MKTSPEPITPDPKADTETASRLPKDLFTVQTFGTLSGCVVAAGVVVTVLCGVFKWDPKIVGLIVSMIVAYVALFLAKKPRPSECIITCFNGFLIYLTLVGATSFSPYLNSQTAATASTDGAKRAPLVRPWVQDRNLVEANRHLLVLNREQRTTLDTVESSVGNLQEKVQRSSLPAPAKQELTAGLAANKTAISTVRASAGPRVATLRRLGVH